jgi:hypothetical protein
LTQELSYRLNNDRFSEYNHKGDSVLSVEGVDFTGISCVSDRLPLSLHFSDLVQLWRDWHPQPTRNRAIWTEALCLTLIVQL